MQVTTSEGSEEAEAATEAVETEAVATEAGMAEVAKAAERVAVERVVVTEVAMVVAGTEVERVVVVSGADPWSIARV